MRNLSTINNISMHFYYKKASAIANAPSPVSSAPPPLFPVPAPPVLFGVVPLVLFVPFLPASTVADAEAEVFDADPVLVADDFKDVAVPAALLLELVELLKIVIFDCARVVFVMLNEFPAKIVRPADLTTFAALKLVRDEEKALSVFNALLLPVMLRSI
jgi:hypothetical protein